MGVDRTHAWEFLRRVVNPRWVRDHEEEARHDRDLAHAAKSHRGLFSCCQRKEKYRLATLEEEHSELIPVFGSNIDDMGMFGIGIGLYFKQTMAFFWLSLLYGLLLLPSVAYFRSDAYNDLTVPVNGTLPAPPPLLKLGSAMCTNYAAVRATSGCADPDAAYCEATFADNCHLEATNGYYDFAAAALVLLYCLVSHFLQKKEVEAIDEEWQTPQDYSVVVRDPDADADDPDEWERFFRQFGEVAYITITRQNRKLLEALAQRRTIMHEMFLHEIPEEIPMDERSQLIHAGKPGLCAPKDAKYWHYQLWKVNQKVDALSADQRTYPVGEVYCIFSTEEGQRQCLNALTTGKIPAMFEIGDKPKEHRFRGTNVLEVEEPVEPSEVIWQNLEISGFTFFVQGVVTALLTLAVIAACYYVIVQLKESGSTKSTGVVVSLINAVLPMVLKAIVMFEKHVDDGDRQDSLFAKLTAARFMNTAIINWVVTSFSNTLSETSLKTIMSILVADAFITPTIQLLNVMGNLKMHVLSKLAKTQPKLLSYFTGAQWYLGERYTSHTKTFFVAIFYAALFPAGMFVAALCFAYGYWVDKYLLLRVWKKPPQYDAQLAAQARGHTVLAVLAHVLVTANWYYGWPFDSATAEADGTYAKVDKMGITPGNPLTWYKFYSNGAESWHGEDQEVLVALYRTAGLALLAILAVVYFVGDLKDWVTSLFYGDYDEVGSDQNIPYQAVGVISAYVPMGVPPKAELAGPLAAAHCLHVDPRHYPDMSGKDFRDMNLAEEFPPADSYRLFGILKGYNTSPVDTEASGKKQKKSILEMAGFKKASSPTKFKKTSP